MMRDLRRIELIPTGTTNRATKKENIASVKKASRATSPGVAAETVAISMETAIILKVASKSEKGVEANVVASPEVTGEIAVGDSSEANVALGAVVAAAGKIGKLRRKRVINPLTSLQLKSTSSSSP